MSLGRHGVMGSGASSAGSWRACLVNACYASFGDRLSVKIRPFSSAYTHSGVVELSPAAMNKPSER